MTTVVISQPMYFPWPGFFELVATADVFVHLDDVQIADRGFTNRVQLKGAQGITWLTVPLKDRTHRKLISELEAAGDRFSHWIETSKEGRIKLVPDITDKTFAFGGVGLRAISGLEMFVSQFLVIPGKR